MNIQEKIDYALKANEILTYEERWELQNLMEGMQFDRHFMGAEAMSEHHMKLIAVIGFLQGANRISEDEEEELDMIVNEIESGRKA